MKKFFLGMLAIVAMIATSCVQDQSTDLGVGVGETAAVSFNVGTATRAYSDGMSVNELHYAVYAVRGEELVLLGITGTEDVENGHAAINGLELATGDTYTMLLWAQVEGAPYKVDFEKMTVKVNYEGAVSNDESRDAFFAAHTFTVNGPCTESVTLTRPFAQINIGSSDFEAMKTAGREIAKSAVTVPAYTTLNLATGEVVGEASAVTFGWADIPVAEETFPVAGHKYLAMNYILVGTEQDQGLVDVQFSYATDDEAYTRTRIVGSVPVKRNYRTNLYGKLFTSTTGVNVDINPAYEGEKNEQVGVKIGTTCYTTLAEAYAAAQDGDELVVVGDILLDEQFVIEKNITLNLNGNEITTTYNATAKKHLYAFEVKADAAVTIKGGTIKSRGIYNYGTLTLEEGAVIDACDANGGYGIYNFGTFVMNDGSEVKTSYEDDNLVDMGGYDATTIRAERKSITTINGGVVNNISDYTFALDIQSGATVTVNDGKFTSIHSTVSNYGTLTINGGEFICNGLEGITAHVLVAWGDSTTTINGGTFDGKDNYNGFNVDAVAGATVYIKGGEFKSVHSGSLYGEGTIVVSGGIFFDNIAAERLAEGCSIEQNENGTWKVEGKGWYVDANGNYHIEGAKGWLWMADQNDTFFGSKTIYLDNDIDFSGKDIRVTRMWTNEYSATFDGQNHTISNVWMASAYNQNNQALFDGLMTVKNLNVDRASVFGMSQVGIIGANIFGNIENCHVTNSRSYGYVHHIGGIVGLHSWGEIKNCSVENTSIECYYYGAVGAIAGAMNEVSRKITGCSVKDCRVIKEGPEGVYPDWDPRFGIAVGYAYAPGAYVFNVEAENNTIKGVASEQMYGEVPAGSTVTINGVQQ